MDFLGKETKNIFHEEGSVVVRVSATAAELPFGFFFVQCAAVDGFRPLVSIRTGLPRRGCCCCCCCPCGLRRGGRQKCAEFVDRGWGVPCAQVPPRRASFPRLVPTHAGAVHQESLWNRTSD